MDSFASHMATAVYSLADAAAAPDAAVQVSWPPHDSVAMQTCSADGLPGYSQYPDRMLCQRKQSLDCLYKTCGSKHITMNSV